MEFVDYKTILIIFHIFGAVLGAGGAFISDAMFFSSVKDRVVSKTEIRFMKIGSTFVWTGLGILIASGALLFLINPEAYSSSSKFLIKMLIVLVILLNGIIFHLKHLPLINRHIDHHYPSSDEFNRKKKLLIASGVVSMTSWTLTIILGVLPSIPLTFTTSLIAYVVFEFLVVSGALILAKRLF